MLILPSVVDLSSYCISVGSPWLPNLPPPRLADQYHGMAQGAHLIKIYQSWSEHYSIYNSQEDSRKMILCLFIICKNSKQWYQKQNLYQQQCFILKRKNAIDQVGGLLFKWNTRIANFHVWNLLFCSVLLWFSMYDVFVFLFLLEEVSDIMLPCFHIQSICVLLVLSNLFINWHLSDCEFEQGV